MMFDMLRHNFKNDNEDNKAEESAQPLHETTFEAVSERPLLVVSQVHSTAYGASALTVS